jgi:hypothetical protein
MLANEAIPVAVLTVLGLLHTDSVDALADVATVLPLYSDTPGTIPRALCFS